MSNKFNNGIYNGMPKVVFDEDGTEKSLPSMNYDTFEEFLFKHGASDVGYGRYCAENNFVDLTDINDQTTGEITLVAENPFMGRVLKFRCVYDSEKDENFDEREYFGEHANL